jgi:cell division transport system permease protein
MSLETNPKRTKPLFQPERSFSKLWVSWLSAHGMAFRLSIRNLLMHPLTTLITLLSLAVTLSLPGASYLTYKNTKLLLAGWDKGTTITAFLQENISLDQAQELVRAVESREEVFEALYQSPEQNLQEFRELSGLKDVIDSLPSNPLPGVITIYPNQGYEKASALSQLQGFLQGFPEIQSVEIDLDWVQKMNAYLHFGKALTLVIGILVALTVILVISNIIRLTLERHKDETEVLSLIGATKYFIARPFLYRGFWYGLLGGIFSFGLLSIVIDYLQKPMDKLSFLYQQPFMIYNLGLGETLILLLISGGLGLTGAWIAVRSQLSSLNKYA